MQVSEVSFSVVCVPALLARETERLTMSTGGISFFSAREGFACDNILSLEIVLPSGEITTVSETSHPDLFRALKGAGQNNFGIVTSFKLRVLELPNRSGIWHRSRMYMWDKIPEIREANYKLSSEGVDKDEQSVTQFSAWVWTKEYGRIVINQQYHVSHADASSAPATFKHFESIESVPQTDVDIVAPMSNVTAMVEASNPVGMRTSYATFSYHADVELDTVFTKLWEEATEKIMGVETYGFVMVFQPLSKGAFEKMAVRGGNALGLSAKDGPMVNVNLPFSWRHKKDDELVRSTQKELMEKLEQAAKDAGKWHPFKYINYADEWQPVYQSYGKDFAWLQEVQRKYDPEGVFTKEGLSSGWWKLNDKKLKEKIRDEL